LFSFSVKKKFRHVTSGGYWRRAAKRALDLAVSSTALLFFSPAMAATVLIIRCSMGAPVLFRQQRPGLSGRPFTMLKFRTMTDLRSANGDPLPDSARLTRIGDLLRSLSLDELPQLWNVLKGDISLVGPRPLLMEYLERYTPEQARRHNVIPGMTGWAQINGRNTLSWDEKFALDVWYVDHWSLALDARILFTTLKQVLLRRDISSAGHATMPTFLGDRND
jgi:lipopolysaccharide/colanic/teichoic acid biosynthesis glycosyltransferase